MLLDVTRLIWRRWRGGVPTGVDRVCLAYLEHFAPQARATVQRKGVHLTLTKRASRRLFEILLSGGPYFRRRISAFAVGSMLRGTLRAPRAGALYINVGHTGLDEPSLPAWVARHRLRAIYLIHDLIPITHPQFCRAGEDEKHLRRMSNVLDSAAGIIANSQDTADEMAALAGRLEKAMPPMVVAWLAGNALQRRPVTRKTEHRFFLVLGTIEGRKNHQLLLAVWRQLFERLGDATPHLFIVGTRGWKAEDVHRQLDALGPLEPFVHEVSGGSDAKVSELMGGARALLMPSYAEGYGLPVFEALELGVPVIAADLPVYREVAGDIPDYLPPDDVDRWSSAVIDYLGDEPRRSAQQERLKSFKVPNWSAHFATVEQWLGRLLD